MDMLKNDLIQEVKRGKTRFLFWLSMFLSVLIILTILGLLQYFGIEYSETWVWIVGGIYFLGLMGYLIYYRFVVKVTDFDLSRHAEEKRRRLNDDNDLDQENIDLYEGVIKHLKDKQITRTKECEKLERFTSI